MRYWRLIGMKPQNGSYADLRSLCLVDGHPGDGGYSNTVHISNGAFNDYSPKGNHFQVHIGAPQVSVDGALVFDGTDDILKFPVTDFVSGSDSFTVELEFEFLPRTTGVSSPEYEYFLCGQYDSSKNSRSWGVLITEAAGAGYFRTSANGAATGYTQVAFTLALTPGVRNHLAFEKDGALGRVYLNGALIASAALVPSMHLNATVPYTVGGMGNASLLSGAYGQCTPMKVYGHRISKGAIYGGTSFAPPKWLGLAATQAASRVDENAAITSSLVPLEGGIANLQTGAGVVRLGVDMSYPRQFIQWDFGPGALPPNGYRAVVFESDGGAGLLSGQLQCSADGVNWLNYAHDTSFFNVDRGQVLPFTVASPLPQWSTAKTASFGPVPAWQTKHAAEARGQDQECGGRGAIYGTVELYNPAGNIAMSSRRVRLHRSRDGLLVRETWSNTQGQYRFDGISQRYTYDVIAWDHEGLQRSVVANDLTPEVMP